MKRLILLTNDDGYESPALRALWETLDAEHETVVIAPKRQRSWIGKAMTARAALTLHSTRVHGKPIHFLDDGAPADCANVGIYHLCPRKPDLVISGINFGPNFTSSLTLASGTVGGALEAAENGVLGLAVGHNLSATLYRAFESGARNQDVEFFREPARLVAEFVRQLFASPPPPDVRMINLVIPQEPVRPYRLVYAEPLAYEYGSVFGRQGDVFKHRSLGFVENGTPITPGSDVWVVQQGWIAYTTYTGKLERARELDVCL